MMYKCPICGIVLTEKQYQEEIKNGSMGMCFCEYTPEDKVLNKYEQIENLIPLKYYG